MLERRRKSMNWFRDQLKTSSLIDIGSVNVQASSGLIFFTHLHENHHHKDKVKDKDKEKDKDKDTYWCWQRECPGIIRIDVLFSTPIARKSSSSPEYHHHPDEDYQNFHKTLLHNMPSNIGKYAGTNIMVFFHFVIISFHHNLVHDLVLAKNSKLFFF